MMNNIFKIVRNFVAVPLGGSVFYIILSDLYHIYVSKLQNYPKPRSYKGYLNPGLVIGGFVGYLAHVYGVPLYRTFPKILK